MGSVSPAFDVDGGQGNATVSADPTFAGQGTG